MKIQQAYIQLIGDAIIPLAGALFFDWGLYFILVYYCLDLIAREVILQLKSKKIIEFSGINNNLRMRYTVLSVLYFLLGLAMIHAAVYVIHPTINFQKELIDFMSYEEMGIQQGFILLPLIAFAAFQQYRMSFLMPAKFRSMSLEEIWKPHHQSQLIVIAAAGIAIGVAQVVALPDLVYVLAIVAVSSLYQLWQLRK